MSLRDRDLISIQEARQAVERAAQAQKRFAEFSQEQIDAVVEACAEAATQACEPLARLAVEETGYGNVPDKILKNRFASVDVAHAIRGMKTAGILLEDRERGIIEIGEPVGVVAAIIPSTNPTSTAIYKTLIALKARNSVVMSPHPSAMRCICETVSVLRRAALKMGAPEGLIECLETPTTQGTQELMKHRSVGVILATGGSGLVRAAYSSGRPAYGVGPGNVPACIERTADVKKAVADIFAGKTFDYGTICSSEQAIVAEEAVRERVLEECRSQDGYFLSPEEIAKLGALVFRPGSLAPNPQIVGRAATVIAEMAGIKVPASTRVLIARLDGVGREFPLSAEKLSPILAFYSAPHLAACIELCVRLLQHGGMGHTASIHSQSEAAVKQFGIAVPAFRVVVNSASVHGSIGYSTNLFPAMTLGCGSPGGNITSDNIGPRHLMNIKRVAWESRGVEHRTIPAAQRLTAVSALNATNAPGAASSPKPLAAPASHGDEIIVPAAPKIVAAVAAAAAGASSGGAQGAPSPASGEATPDRATIARIVERVFTSRGIPRGGVPKGAAEMETKTAAAAPACATVESVASEVVAAALAARKKTAASASVPEKAPAPAELAPAAPEAPKAAAAPIRVAEFVCENDVRGAGTRGEKIFIGPKTIVTPSAREYAQAHDIFVLTDISPASGKSRNEG